MNNLENLTLVEALAVSAGQSCNYCQSDETCICYEGVFLSNYYVQTATGYMFMGISVLATIAPFIMERLCERRRRQGYESIEL